MVERELGLQPAVGLVELQDVEVARLSVSERELAQERGDDLTEVRLAQVDDEAVRAADDVDVFLPQADGGPGRSPRLCRGVDFEEAVRRGLSHKPANPRVGLGRQELGEVVDGGGRQPEVTFELRGERFVGARPGRSR